MDQALYFFPWQAPSARFGCCRSGGFPFTSCHRGQCVGIYPESGAFRAAVSLSRGAGGCFALDGYHGAREEAATLAGGVESFRNSTGYGAHGRDLQFDGEVTLWHRYAVDGVLPVAGERHRLRTARDSDSRG